MLLVPSRDSWSSAELPLLSAPAAAAPGAPAGPSWCRTNPHGLELTLPSTRLWTGSGNPPGLQAFEKGRRASRSPGSVPSLLCDMSTD